MEKHNLWIEVDIEKIRNNIAKVKTLVDDTVGVMAIVKANAYGHGMAHIAHAIADIVNYFGVSTFTEAEILRTEGILTPILILGSILPYEFEPAIDHDLTLSVSDSEYAQALNTVGRQKNKKVKVHLKIDTGMGRWGFIYKYAYNEIKKVLALPFLDGEGIFTHFPVADNEKIDFTERQIELFKALIDELERDGIIFSYMHAANSAGIVNFKESHFNLIRPGMIMYGYYPHESLHEKLHVEQALSIKGRICLIKEFEPRRGVSYGRRYITEKRTKIGVIPIGYSHGYPYALSQKGIVLIQGRRYPIAGSVCMDYIMVDLGDDSHICIGDEVVLLGTSGKEEMTAYELAKKARTIPYEIISNLSLHIPRIYIHNTVEQS